MPTQLYKVKKKDTVLTICLLHRLRYDQFVSLNPQFGDFGHRNPDEIFVGEYLVVAEDKLSKKLEVQNENRRSDRDEQERW